MSVWAVCGGRCSCEFTKRLLAMWLCNKMNNLEIKCSMCSHKSNGKRCVWVYVAHTRIMVIDNFQQTILKCNKRMHKSKLTKRTRRPSVSTRCQTAKNFASNVVNARTLYQYENEYGARCNSVKIHIVSWHIAHRTFNVENRLFVAQWRQKLYGSFAIEKRKKASSQSTIGQWKKIKARNRSSFFVFHLVEKE